MIRLNQISERFHSVSRSRRHRRRCHRQKATELILQRACSELNELRTLIRNANERRQHEYLLEILRRLSSSSPSLLSYSSLPLIFPLLLLLKEDCILLLFLESAPGTFDLEVPCHSAASKLRHTRTFLCTLSFLLFSREFNLI